jgi:putative DNA primase/helicase
MKKLPDFPDVAAMLGDRVAELALHLCGQPTGRHRDEWRYRRKGSLAVVVAGRKRGSWFDHEAGQGGDALGLIAHLNGVPMREAYRWALGWLGVGEGCNMPPRPERPVAPPEAKIEASATLATAQRVWMQAAPAAGTVVEAYLASRGLALPEAAPIRFHGRCPRGGGEKLPAMITLMVSPNSGEAVGVHRTFLRPDGSGKADGTAKMMLGNAGLICLTPPREIRDVLGVVEGIETGLAVMQRGGWRPIWAATSAGNIASLPVLPTIQTLHLFADADRAGLEAARRCARAWAAAGRKARVIWPPSGDWDDALGRGRGTN